MAHIQQAIRQLRTSATPHLAYDSSPQASTQQTPDSGSIS